MDEILTIFNQLKLHEQTALVNLLPTLIKVDFISCLPFLVSERIISYLPVKDAVRCCLVCIRWRDTIMACTQYWMRVCYNVGLTEVWMNNEYQRYHTFSLFTFAITIHHMMIDVTASLKEVASTPLAKDNKISTNNRFMWKVLEGYDDHDESAYFDTNSSVYYQPNEQLFTYIECGKVCKFTYSSSLKLSLIGACTRGLVTATSDGELMLIKDELQNKWLDSELILRHSATVCYRCGLVAHVHRTHSSSGLLNFVVSFIVLDEQVNYVKRFNHPINLLTVDPTLKGSDVIFLVKLALLNSVPPNDYSFCSKHYLLIQFNCSILMFVVSYDSNSFQVTYQHSFNTSSNPASDKPLLNLNHRNSTFRLSLCDSMQGASQVLGFLNDFTLFIWNISSGDLVAQYNLIKYFKAVDDIVLLGVGEVYLVLQYGFEEISVISSLTGKEVHRIVANSAPVIGRIRFCLLNEVWMNDFGFYLHHVPVNSYLNP